MEHTPGPWSCYHEGTREVNDTFVHTFIVVTPNTVAHDNSIGIETSKLIAAAPEMFEALESSIRHFWRFAEWDRSILLLKNPDHPVFKWESIINKAKNG